MDQRALCELDRSRTVRPEAARRTIPLQRSLSAAPRLQTQGENFRSAAYAQLLHPHSFPTNILNDTHLQGAAEHQAADEASPGASSLSTPQSSQLSFGSSPYSCTTRSSTPTSILEPPTTEKRHRTPPFTVYDAQPQNFKNPLFGTKASPSPQPAAYRGNASAPFDRIDLESPACGPTIAREHVSGQNNMATPVANLSRDINAVAMHQDATAGQMTDDVDESSHVS